jgi:long-chain acyl-CoA synthetase
MRLLRRFSPENVQRALEDSKPTFLPLVPTMVTRLYQAGIVYDRPILLGIGAAGSPAQIAQDAWSVFPRAYLYFGYGLTEATAIASLNRVGTKEANNGDFATAGRVVPGVEVRLGFEQDAEGRGEILISGEGVFSAYVGTNEPRPVKNGQLHTGDIGVFEGDALRIVDRKRELIIRGGQNIYPGEVERILSQHESVLEAVVVGVPDADFGEIPVAFVVTRNNIRTTSRQLIEWMRPQVASFKLPTVIHLVESMPKTPTGKIRKLDLQETATANTPISMGS